MLRPFLILILAAYCALGALYALFTPKWQAPDEPAHFNYIRSIGDTGALPVLQNGDYNQEYLEKIKKEKFPASLSIDGIRYESYQPPLYYIAATPFYLIARAGGLDAQVFTLRLFGVALGAILLWLAFTTVREIFPDDGFLALATVGAMATVPMHIAISASVSNDTAAELVLALILLLAVKRVKNVVSDTRYAIVGGILFGAALLTKTTTYVPGALLLVGAEIARARLTTSGYRLAIRSLISTFLISVIISLPMFARNVLIYGIADPLGIARHDAIVVGQPTTAEMIARYGFNHIAFDFFAVTMKSFWAQFGWMGVLVNDRIYVALFLLSGAAAFGFALWTIRILRQRDSLSAVQYGCIGLLALLLLSGLVDYVLYNFKLFQLQGRYLFPALIPIALFGVFGLREIIAKEYVRVCFALLYIALLALDVVSLFLFIVPQLSMAN